ncbi:alkene reductase [Pseudorhodoplanes sp.]|uniref:alkene reductase n=1 Tax=Pseudorhodoplanes sp. TaxID=1934341 RepID=UPI00391D2114
MIHATAAAKDSQAAEPLFEPYQLGPLHLSNRIVMAPMTRSRALDGNVPNPLAEIYYRQRASAGLIITEASQVSPQGVGYIRTPGIHSPEQIAAWRRITAAVAREGGKIFLQLWHVGRISHPDFHDGALPVAPSAIAPEGEVFTAQGPKKMVTPRALDASELPGIVEQFRTGAENAKAAGFDGVELHGANGYLLDQFTRDGSNHRTDDYGGSIENRVRFPLDVTKAVIDVWGNERVGYRVSPTGAYNSMTDSDPRATFSYLTQRLSDLGIGYLHVTEPVSAENRVTPHLRPLFKGTFIVNGGYDAASGNAAIAKGEADLVAYGVPFIANPDLPYRFGRKASLAATDPATFYTGEDKGYTDYPALRA